MVPSNSISNLESVKTEPGETDSSQRSFVSSMTSKQAYKKDILIFSQKVSSFPSFLRILFFLSLLMDYYTIVVLDLLLLLLGRSVFFFCFFLTSGLI